MLLPCPSCGKPSPDVCVTCLVRDCMPSYLRAVLNAGEESTPVNVVEVTPKKEFSYAYYYHGVDSNISERTDVSEEHLSR